MNRRKLFIFTPLGLIIFVLLGGWIADWWLESNGGRDRLQNELSGSLGMPVRLTGDYSLSLFPNLQIKGTGLELGLRNEAGLVGEGEGFWAVIEWLPFLNGQLKIKSVGLSSGFIDPNQFSAQFTNAGPTDRPSSKSGIYIPEISSLQVQDFVIRFSGNDNGLHIRELQLSAFKAGQISPFSLEALLNGSDNELGTLRLEGGIKVAPDGSKLEIEVLSADFNAPKMSLKGMSAKGIWVRQTETIAVDLNWTNSDQSLEMSFELTTVKPISGAANLQYQSASLPAHSAADLNFSLKETQVEFPQISLLLAGQSIKGSGCFLFADNMAVHASLQANELKLAELYAMLPAQNSDSKSDEMSELPLEFNLLLEVENATYEQVTASDVRVLIGEEPDCSQVISSLP